MLDRGHSARDTQRAFAPVDLLDGDQSPTGTHNPGAVVETLDRGQTRTGTQRIGALVNPFGEGHQACGTQATSALADSLLLVYADTLDDLERTRIATENRLRSLRQIKGLAASPEADQLEGLLAGVARLEHTATLNLRRAMRAHPLGAWVKGTVGVGEKQAARLLAAIGDPAARTNVAKLWAYCGFHVVDGKRPRRARGEQSSWSNTAKMRARLIAESCIKQLHSPYRAVYDRERAKWADRDTTDLHKHNHALSVVAKDVLKDLWVAAKAAAA